MVRKRRSKADDACRPAGRIFPAWGVVLAIVTGLGTLTTMPDGRARAAPGPETLARASALVLGDRPIAVTLTIAGGSRRLDTAPLSEKIFLVLKDAQAAQPPGTLYRVSLGPRGDVVGSVNFFNAEPGRPRVYSFDVTDVLRTLHGTSLGDTLNVTIGPSGTPEPGARPTIGEIVIVAQ